MISKQLLDLTKQYEGCRLDSYQDVVGVWTIGYGCTGKDIGPGMVWTQEQVDSELMKRLEQAQLDILACTKVKLNPNQLDALADFVYNLGVHAYIRSTLKEKLEAGDPTGASNEFIKWCYAGSTISLGLVRRRKAEKAMFLS